MMNALLSSQVENFKESNVLTLHDFVYTAAEILLCKFLMYTVSQQQTPLFQ
jgi:hypothetical protein